MTSPPPQPLSRELIVATALDLIDREGLAALSLRALADRLGAGPMSLYRHIRDKADIHDGVRALLLSQIALPAPTADGLADLGAWAVAFRAQMRAHPNAVALFTNRPADAYLTAREAAEGALAHLEAAGLTPADAALALRSVVRFVIGFSLTDPQPEPDGAGEPERLREAGYPRLAALIAATGPDDERLFRTNLAAILDGFARQIADGPPVDRRARADTITP